MTSTNPDINILNNGLGEASPKVQVDVASALEALNVIVSGTMLGLSVYKIYDDTEDGRLNPLNPQLDGRESSNLSSLFFALLPLLLIKVLYHAFRFYKERQSPNAKLEESGGMKVLRHISTIIIVVVVLGSWGLISHASPQYCDKLAFADGVVKNGTADSLHILVDSNKSDDKPGITNLHPHVHEKRCLVEDLKQGDDKYGSEYISLFPWLVLGSGLLRLIGLFQDDDQPNAVIKFIAPDDIPPVKFFILLLASVITIVAGTLSRATDLNEEYVGADGKNHRILSDDDLAFFTVLLVAAYAHAGLLVVGFSIKIFQLKSDFWSKYSFTLFNNIPLVRVSVVSIALASISYLIGMATVSAVDTSFLSIALVSEIALDLFGRNKKKEIA